MAYYIGPDGEKPVINQKIDDRFIEMPLERLKTFKTSQENAPVIEKAKEKPEKAEKPEKRPPLDKNLKEGIRLFRMKRWENSLKELLLVKAENFDDEEKAELAYYLGLCYTKLDKYEEAVLQLEQAVTTGKDLLRAYQCRLTLAYIYVITDRAKMADFELNRLQKGGFESAPLFNTLAYSAYVQKRYQNAIELYEKALDLDENNATALNSMGYILADTGIDKTKGLRLCRRAVERSPKNAAYLDSLGWAHFKCGNFTEARNWLNRAVDIAPKEKEIKEHYRIVAGGKAW